MCQYSAADGSATDWHVQPLDVARDVRRRDGDDRGDRRSSGAGASRTAASGSIPTTTKRRPSGRWMRRGVSRRPARCFGIQLAHAGRKASVKFPWEGGKPLTADGGSLADGRRPPRSPSTTAGMCRKRSTRTASRGSTSAFVAGGKARRARRLRLRRDSWRTRLSAARIPLAVLQQAGRPLRRAARESHAADPRSRAGGARGAAGAHHDGRAALGDRVDRRRFLHRRGGRRRARAEGGRRRLYLRVVGRQLRQGAGADRRRSIRCPSPSASAARPASRRAPSG